MNGLRQRQPRIEDAAWLAEVRKMPCLVCRRPGPSDPAHIRAAAPQYGKRYTGKAEKPDDCWVLPLCRTHHDAQHRESELGWWAGMGIPDPFAVAVALYESRPDKRPYQPRKKVKTITRRPKEQRSKVGKSRPLPTGRKIENGDRKIPSRPLRSKSP